MKTHDEFDLPVKKSPEERAAEVRLEFPKCSAMVDEFKAVFGDVQVLYMQEDGREIRPKNYKTDNDYTIWMGPERFLQLGQKSQEAFDYANPKEKDAKSK